MYFDCAYPVDNATVGSEPTGSSGTVGEIWPGPMHVLMLLVKARVLGRRAWQRRRRDIVSIFAHQHQPHYITIKLKDRKR
jgi:hypothetical protein